MAFKYVIGTDQTVIVNEKLFLQPKITEQSFSKS